MQCAEHQVTGKRSLHGDLGSFLIADFTDQNRVRVLSQHRSQNAPECQLDVGLDLTLNDAVDVVFDRILGGNQLAARIVQLAQGRVKRRRLARTRRARADGDSVGLVNELADRVEIVLAQAELVEIEAHVAAVEHAHDHGLAEHRRQNAHAQIDRLIVHRQLDAPVLRQPALGNVEIRHDLDARADRRRDVRGRRHHFVQHAVDAIAHLEFILERLEVNVRGLVLDGLQKHEVDKIADVIGIGGFLERVEVDRFAAPLEILERVVGRQLAQNLADAFGGGVVVLSDELIDLLGIADLGGDVQANELSQVIQRAEVLVIGHHDGQLLAGRIKRDGQNFVRRCNLRRNRCDCGGRDRDAAQIDELVAALRG